MTVEQYLEEMKPGFTVPGGSDAHLVMHEMSQKALQITMELNNKYHTHEEIIQLMSELTGHEIDDSFGMFPAILYRLWEKHSYREKMYSSMQDVNFRIREEYISEMVH